MRHSAPRTFWSARAAVAMATVMLCGCDGQVDSLVQAADGVRTQTERMAASSRQASDQREANIIAEAREMQAAQQGELEAAVLADGPRYVLRGGPNGFTVYDAETGERASSAGLTRGQAEETIADLRAEELAGALDQQRIRGGGR